MKKRKSIEALVLLQMGERIRIARKAKGITQQTMADLCNSEKATVCRIESGKINAKALTLKKIADVLGIHLTELLATNEE